MCIDCGSSELIKVVDPRDFSIDRFCRNCKKYLYSAPEETMFILFDNSTYQKKDMTQLHVSEAE